mmetsp:Transcript_23818/g.66934  ORF Transcript_23818/g.66934 Transcript_23818/m.66934 type:complete len:98 (-) Transcript_23818:742-1035(-)
MPFECVLLCRASKQAALELSPTGRASGEAAAPPCSLLAKQGKGDESRGSLDAPTARSPVPDHDHDLDLDDCCEGDQSEENHLEGASYPLLRLRSKSS